MENFILVLINIQDALFEMQGKVLKLAFSLQKALKTIISFVYHKSKTLHFTYFLNSIIQKGSHLLKETAILPQNYIYLRKSLILPITI